MSALQNELMLIHLKRPKVKLEATKNLEMSSTRRSNLVYKKPNLHISPLPLSSYQKKLEEKLGAGSRSGVSIKSRSKRDFVEIKFFKKKIDFFSSDLSEGDYSEVYLDEDYNLEDL